MGVEEGLKLAFPHEEQNNERKIYKEGDAEKTKTEKQRLTVIRTCATLTADSSKNLVAEQSSNLFHLNLLIVQMGRKSTDGAPSRLIAGAVFLRQEAGEYLKLLSKVLARGVAA